MTYVVIAAYTNSKKLVFIALLVILIGVILLKQIFYLEFYPRELDSLISLLYFIAVSILLYIYAVLRSNKVWKFVISIIFSVVIVVLIGAASISYRFYRTSPNENLFLQVLESYTVNGYKITAYQLNEGGMGGYSVVVKQEKELLPYLRVVKNIYRAENQESIEIKLSGQDAVSLYVWDKKVHGYIWKDYKIYKWLYF